jgi:hypothetical protein
MTPFVKKMDLSEKSKTEDFGDLSLIEARLLALNAAYEAAANGEAGAEFGALAGEMQALVTDEASSLKR